MTGLWEKRKDEIIEFARQGWTMRQIGIHYRVTPAYAKFMLHKIGVSLIHYRNEG